MTKQAPQCCHRVFIPLGVVVMALFAGCAPTFAPPSRVAVGAMPELDEPGRGHVRAQAGTNGTFALRAEGGIASGMTLEVGGSGSTAQDGMAMLGFGVRRELYATPRGAVVGVGGVSVGCGGAIEGVGGCGSRFAWGTYLGLDVGYRVVPWFGVYQGSRWQWSVGEGALPVTLWQLYVLGGQLSYKRVYVSFELGYARFDSVMEDRREVEDSEDGPHLSLGVGARW